jgi:Phage integrase, N-terminal SAM-like domain
MARPPLPLGEHGSISVAPKRGLWVARCRVRGFDGVTRHIQKSGKSKTAARLALQDELRAQRGERSEVLRPESRFREAADVWMGKIRERREDSTADTYASCLRNQVLPQLGELRLVECDVAHLDAFFSRLERARKVVEQPDGTTVEKPQLAANTRRMVRAIVGGVMQQAVLHQAGAANRSATWSASSCPRAIGKRLRAASRPRSAGACPRTSTATRPRSERHARPDPLRPRLRAAHRRDLRPALDGPRHGGPTLSAPCAGREWPARSRQSRPESRAAD